jgi:hypothetical protein
MNEKDKRGMNSQRRLLGCTKKDILKCWDQVRRNESENCPIKHQLAENQSHNSLEQAISGFVQLHKLRDQHGDGQLDIPFTVWTESKSCEEGNLQSYSQNGTPVIYLQLHQAVCKDTSRLASRQLYTGCTFYRVHQQSKCHVNYTACEGCIRREFKRKFVSAWGST